MLDVVCSVQYVSVQCVCAVQCAVCEDTRRFVWSAMQLKGSETGQLLVSKIIDHHHHLKTTKIIEKVSGSTKVEPGPGLPPRPRQFWIIIDHHDYHSIKRCNQGLVFHQGLVNLGSSLVIMIIIPLKGGTRAWSSTKASSIWDHH